jgi:DNA-binding response OmpR family regulator
VEVAGCCEEAFRLLSSCPVSAIITNDALPDGGWARILGHVQAQSRPPNLIVASRLADERLWAEVLNLGGYDVLIKPFVADEVRRVVSLACPLPARRDSLAGEPAKANFAASAA